MLSLAAGLDKFVPIGKASTRVAVLGIGNELAGDDAVGVRIARELGSRLRPGPDRVVFDGGSAPENFTGPIRRFRPDLVLLVDAAHVSAEPGTVAWIDWHDSDGLSASTHTLPPSVLADFLATELGCRLALLVVQPAQLEPGSSLSPAVRRAADEVIDALARRLGT